MSFPTRLAQPRKQQRLSERRFADLVGPHVNQIKRHETGDARPPPDPPVNSPPALHIGLDALVFEEPDRGVDPDLRRQFEALCQFTPQESASARTVLEALILRHTAAKLSRKSTDAA